MGSPKSSKSLHKKSIKRTLNKHVRRNVRKTLHKRRTTNKRRTTSKRRTISKRRKSSSLQRGGGDEAIMRGIELMIKSAGFGKTSELMDTLIEINFLSMVLKRYEKQIPFGFIDGKSGFIEFLKGNDWTVTEKGYISPDPTNAPKLSSELDNFKKMLNDQDTAEKLEQVKREERAAFKKLNTVLATASSGGASSRASPRASPRASSGASSGESSGGGKPAPRGGTPPVSGAIDKTLQGVRPDTPALVNLGKNKATYIRWNTKKSPKTPSGDDVWESCIIKGFIVKDGKTALSFLWGEGTTGSISSEYVPDMVIPIDHITFKAGGSEKWVPAKKQEAVIYNGDLYRIHSTNAFQITLESTDGKDPIPVQGYNIHKIFHSKSKLNQGSITLATGPHGHIAPGQKIYRATDLTGTEYRVLDVVGEGTLFRIIKTGESLVQDVPVGDFTLLLPSLKDLSGQITFQTGFRSREVTATYSIERDTTRNGGIILMIAKGRGDIDKYLLQSIVPDEEGYYKIVAVKISSSNQKTLKVQFPNPVGGEENHKQILSLLNESLEL